MLKKKRSVPLVDRRKGDRRKPGDLRFPGRLVDKKAGKPRKGSRRQKDRRKN